jgi:hypothetical protein
MIHNILLYGGSVLFATLFVVIPLALENLNADN